MKPDEIRKLLGGFATGTLTVHERELLFSAALEDQALFDALANEEALREMLADPVTREELLQELRARPADTRDEVLVPVNAPAPRSARLWFQLTPRRLVFAGSLASVVLIIGIIQYVRQVERRQPAEVAMTKVPPPVEPAPARVEPQRAPRSPAPKESAPSALPQSGQVAAKRERQEGAARETDARAPQTPIPQAEPSLAKDVPLSGGARSTVEELAEGKAARQAPPPRAAAPTLSGGFGGSGVFAFSARVTGVNGTVVSIGSGANAGVKLGETLEVVRDSRVLGLIRITETQDTFAVGAFEPVRAAQANADRAAEARADANESPRAGDLVRRPVASPAR